MMRRLSTILHPDFGQCPNGMTCLRDRAFFDFLGNDLGFRDVCVVVETSDAREDL